MSPLVMSGDFGICYAAVYDYEYQRYHGINKLCLNEHVYSPEGRKDRQTDRQTDKQTMPTQSNNTKEMTKNE